jgi:serine protease Do
VSVETPDGQHLPAAWVLARDDENDLAALQVPVAPNLTLPPAVSVGDARALRVGEIIIAVGNPLGVRGTATLGIVSATPGSATWMDADGDRCDLLQADVTLAPGNSGGPLADTSGRVVGIVSMILSPGIALAVPSHVVERFLAAIAEALRRAPQGARCHPARPPREPVAAPGYPRRRRAW